MSLSGANSLEKLWSLWGEPELFFASSISGSSEEMASFFYVLTIFIDAKRALGSYISKASIIGSIYMDYFFSKVSIYFMLSQSSSSGFKISSKSSGSSEVKSVIFYYFSVAAISKCKATRWVS